MYLAIRKYRASSASDADEVERKARQSFLPLVRKAEGFLDYYFIRTAPDAYMTVSVFESQAQADASTRMAAEWIKKTVPRVVPGPPEVTKGEVSFAGHSPAVQEEYSAGAEAPSAPLH